MEDFKFNDEQITKLIDVLYQAVISEGGDGNVLWYTAWCSIDRILPLLTEYNSKLKFPFTIERKDDKTIHWGENQEWVVITSDEYIYTNSPPWFQFTLKY